MDDVFQHWDKARAGFVLTRYSWQYMPELLDAVCHSGADLLSLWIKRLRAKDKIVAQIVKFIEHCTYSEPGRGMGV